MNLGSGYGQTEVSILLKEKDYLKNSSQHLEVTAVVLRHDLQHGLYQTLKNYWSASVQDPDRKVCTGAEPTTEKLQYSTEVA